MAPVLTVLPIEQCWFVWNSLRVKHWGKIYFNQLTLWRGLKSPACDGMSYATRSNSSILAKLPVIDKDGKLLERASDSQSVWRILRVSGDLRICGHHQKLRRTRRFDAYRCKYRGGFWKIKQWRSSPVLCCWIQSIASSLGPRSSKNSPSFY